MLAMTAFEISGAGEEIRPGMVKQEFVFETAPLAQCHASTTAESQGRLLAAWFGGTREKNPDVAFWLSRQEAGRIVGMDCILDASLRCGFRSGSEMGC